MAWTKDDELRLVVRMGLMKGFRLIRGMRRALSEEERDRIAEAIVEHLKLSNYKIEPGPPLEPHGSNLMGGRRP